MNPATRLMVNQLQGLAAEGLTYLDAASRTGCSYGYISAFAARHNIQFALRKRGRKLGSGSKGPGERERDMLKRYTSGETLDAIGKSYRITRERVRQLLTKHYNICGKDGGQAESARKKKRELTRKREARALKSYGCSYRQYKALVRHKDKPVEAYRNQKNNAHTREISWDLNIWQWWSIWQQSGHWSERGRGRGYCMCRLNDVGPYSVDNVYIATGTENMQDYWVNRRASQQVAA